VSIETDANPSESLDGSVKSVEESIAMTTFFPTIGFASPALIDNRSQPESRRGYTWHDWHMI
jgi:hypothetical protein